MQDRDIVHRMLHLETGRRIRTITVLISSILLVLCMAGCGKQNQSATVAPPRVEDMSSGRIQVTITVDPPKVELHKDLLLSIRTVAPSDVEVTLPAIDDRLTGFVLSGVIDDEPVTKDGKTSVERRARLTPMLADEYRISPMAITYNDRSRLQLGAGWFATRPIALERIAPVEHSPGKDIEVVMKPVWIYPTAKTVAIYVMLGVLCVALCYLAWKLARRIHRQIKLMRMSPRERALFELSELLSKDLVGKDMVKEFYLELTMIVRRYIERQHRVRAPEQTTEEFLLAVSRDPTFNRETVRTLKAFLEASDLVKFAADHPTGAEITEATVTAKEYIERDSPEKPATEAGAACPTGAGKR
jgi:hypothetical protein